MACGAQSRSALCTQATVTSNEGTSSSMKKTIHIPMEAIMMDAKESGGSTEDGGAVQARSLIQIL